MSWISRIFPVYPSLKTGAVEKIAMPVIYGAVYSEAVRFDVTNKFWIERIPIVKNSQPANSVGILISQVGTNFTICQQDFVINSEDLVGPAGRTVNDLIDYFLDWKGPTRRGSSCHHVH